MSCIMKKMWAQVWPELAEIFRNEGEMLILLHVALANMWRAGWGMLVGPDVFW